jgi:tripartite-type tricarboxylate transporter receptor subunit TctC
MNPHSIDACLPRGLTVCLVPGVAAAALFAAAESVAQAYPIKTVRIVVAYAPGGANDLVARPIAQKLSEDWKVPVIVDNRPGGNTVVGTDHVAKSPPDGHTLLITPPAFTINASLLPKLPYDALRDFAPVSLLNINPQVLVVNPSVPARSVRQLVALAKARPGGMNCSSAGTGGANHLACELFNTVAAVKIVHIPYKGNAPSLLAVATGEVDLCIASVLSAMALIKGQRLRPLAMTSLQRSSALPQVPTMDEAGFKGFEAVAWAGLAAPGRTPAAIIERLNAAVVRIVQSPELSQRMRAEGSQPVGNTPGQFRAFLENEVAKWRKVIRFAGVRPD